MPRNLDPSSRINPIRIIGGLLVLFAVAVVQVLDALDPDSRPPPRN